MAKYITEDINSENETQAVVQCNNNTTIILDYKRDQNNQMTACLIINKNNQSYPFKFSTHTQQIKINGQFVTKVVQTQLFVFAKTIESYLLATAADRHLSKLPDEPKEFQSDNQQVPYTAGNNNVYRNGNNNGYHNQNYNGSHNGHQNQNYNMNNSGHPYQNQNNNGHQSNNSGYQNNGYGPH